MKKSLLLSIGIALLIFKSASAQAVLVESWENTIDGWTVQDANYTPTFVTTPGVTDGIYSLALTGTTSPTYGQMLLSPQTMLFTSLLGNAASLSIDVFTPPGSFGFFLQFDFDVNNADTGFQSLDGYSYMSTTIGSETTFTIPIPDGIRNALNSSANPTAIAIQIGGGSSGSPQTMYLDNLQITPVPEPNTMALFGFGALGLLKFVRRRR